MRPKKKKERERLKLPSFSPSTPQVQKLVILPVCPPQACKNCLYLRISSLPRDFSRCFPPGGLLLQIISAPSLAPQPLDFLEWGVTHSSLLFKTSALGFLLLADEDRHTRPSGSNPSQRSAKSPLLQNTILPCHTRPPRSPSCLLSLTPLGLCACWSSCLGCFFSLFPPSKCLLTILQFLFFKRM